MSERTESTNTTFWTADSDRPSSQWCRTLVDAVDGGVFQLDADDRLVAIEDRLLERTRYAHEDLLGEHVSVLLAESDESAFERAVRGRNHVDGQRTATLERELSTEAGASIPCELRLRGVRADGQFRGSIGIVRERDPCRTAASSPTAEFDGVASVLEEADVAVFVLDDAFDVAWVNAATERYFGIDRAAVIGRDKRRLIRETIRDRVADPEGFADTVTATYDDNTSAERFDCHVTAGEDRAERWLEHRSKPIESGPYAGGRVELYYDVTDQHRRAAQLRRLNEAVREWLEGRSREAVAERASRQLQDVLGLEINGIYLHDPAAGELRPVAWSEPAAALFEEPLTFADGEGIAWRVFDTGQPAIYDDVTAEPSGYSSETPIRSVICLPLGDHGVALVGSQQRHAFDEADRELANVAASSLESTFDRIRHEHRLERERAQTEKLVRTAPVAIAVEDADGEILLSNERIRETLGVTDGVPIGEAGAVDGWTVVDAAGEVLEPDRSPTARVRATGEPVTDRKLALEGPANERKWFSVNAAPVFGADGTLERVVSVGDDITALKAQERRLERRKSELETELSEILGRVSDAFYALDESWRFTHVNERAEELLGYDREDLLGEVIWDEFPGGTESELVDRFREAMATQQSVSWERYSETLEIWMEIQAYPSESGLSVYFRDVTDRKRRERRLERYERIIETVDDGIYVLDEDGRFTTVNGAYTELTGYDRDELLGTHASLVVDEAVLDLAERTAAGDRDVPTIGTTIETSDGRQVPVEATVTTLPTAEDASVGADTSPAGDDHGRERARTDGYERVAVVRDVTEREERRRRLAESEQRYRTLAENFPDGIVALYDEELRYTAAGGQLVGELEIDRAEMVGRTIEDRLPDDLREEVEPHYRAALDGEERSFQVQYHDRQLLAHTLPVGTGGDVRTGMLVVQDVTERVEYERKLEASNERLEQFAYAASHDLQEPLRMVTSYLQLIERRYSDALDEDGREFIDYAVDGAERMREMIDGLLEYSRVETRGDAFEPVDLDAVLEAVIQDLEVRIEETDAEITVESLPRVDGDGRQLRQVFQNLLSNAISYSGDDPPEVTVSAERDGSQWLVSVSDEGVGIDPDQHDRVFEIFQRLHNDEGHDGTGIGLALCRRIVERHSGAIRIDSEPGEGARFTLSLPAAETK